MKTLYLLTNFFSKSKIFTILTLLIFLTFFEMIGFAVLMPLISFALNFSDEFFLNTENFLIKIIVDLLDIENKFEFLNIYLLIILFYYSFKFFFSLFTIKFYSNFLFLFRDKITETIARNFLTKPYEFYLNTNSSDLVRYTSDEIRFYMDSVISQVLLIVTEIFIITGLIIFSFIISPYLFLITLLFSIICWIIIKLIKIRLPFLGKERLKENLYRQNILQQIFAAIKEIKIFKKENVYLNEIKEVSKKLSSVEKKFFFLESLPRYILEFLIVVQFCVIFYIFFNYINNTLSQYYLSVLGIYILILFRILPSFTRISRCINNINFSKKLENKLFNYIFPKKMTSETISELINFREKIEVKKIIFKYMENQNEITFQKNFTIKKGSFNCVVGKSGSGKTTLLDLLSGLLSPIKLDMIIDGKKIINKPIKLKNKISFVHQNFFLFNDSIKNNICFLEKDKVIDENKLKKVIDISELSNVISKLPDGVNSVIGESGSKLSGGERQRVSIARALYLDAEIIFMDESTNALDKDTEMKILQNLKKEYSGKKTFIMVLHNIVDKSLFDEIIDLS